MASSPDLLLKVRGLSAGDSEEPQTYKAGLRYTLPMITLYFLKLAV
jgi:hypothetical protein